MSYFSKRIDLRMGLKTLAIKYCKMGGPKGTIIINMRISMSTAPLGIPHIHGYSFVVCKNKTVQKEGKGPWPFNFNFF